MTPTVNKITAVLASTFLLGLVGCSDGDDGKDGAPGAPGTPGTPGDNAPLVTTEANTLDLEITNSEIVEGHLAVEFRAVNEVAIPVIRIDGLKVQAVQLQPEHQGDSSEWEVVGYEKCKADNCLGTLEDMEDGTYRYTFAGDVDAAYNALLPQRTVLTVFGNDRYPTAEERSDYMTDGTELTDSRNIVDDGRCLSCHESVAEIKHGGADTANCASCHTNNNMSDATKVWPVMAHQVHVGVTSRPVGNCESCHETEATAELQQALNWMTVPTAETCQSCHDMSANGVYDHDGQTSNENCVVCHSADSIDNDHMGTYKTSVGADERGVVSVDVEDAKLIEENGEHFALISFSVRDRAGERIVLDANNPGEAIWIKNLQMYVNWGASVDFTNSRGYSIFVKSNKQYGASTDNGYTPDGERPRTKPFLGGTQQPGVMVYKMGPIVTNDAISGDLLNDTGFISNRLIYCFDGDQQLVDCNSAGHKKNTAYNERWYFTKDGLTADPSLKRPVIVSNEKCGSCHGYDEFSQNTELACRGCHSRKTDMNKALANTTCFSGHDDDELGNHLLPREMRALSPRGQAGFISSTADIVDPCLACHNPNTPPTQAIRELHTQKGDKDFVEQLVVSHPDHKIWMHSLHANQRATQAVENGVRDVDYPADPANCARCHEGESYGVERLTDVGRPLALDLDYNPDSQAHPATDIADQADMSYVSPVSATCYSCHAKKPNQDGEMVIDNAVRAHMEQNGGKFGVPLAEIEVESCAVCHSVENLKEKHGL